ncbi:Gfo/Idh/MocA family protein [Limnobacter sp.]|uniref:Gfo/Idh/MocA family protein n=1 Tax=Limnobacter sp. TaxID=2003368 RepID=UPI002735D14D|nr:Gfo/Idh/MocA family oxidoreductase [Limnobacter sp.]MDP3187541.1 Gfo/Idh/MocA family oxidoreductase [Limnobacter sp.]
MTLRLGVIGLSPGNGHPYSWSAIFNGYNSKAMEECGFPVIPRYLEKQKFPDDGITAGKVTHIWTQDPLLSKKVAQASLIPFVVDRYTDLIGQVDAVLLARDDAENHLAYASPFLRAGVPIYIDKPLALTMAHAKALLSLQRFPGQLFSCSALRYAPELQLDAHQKKKIGEIQSIQAFTPKDWNRYAIHVIEPLLQLIPKRGELRRSLRWKTSDRLSLMMDFSNDLDVQIHAFGKASAPLSLRVIGADDWCDLFFTNSFLAFRNALLEFVQGVLNRDVRISSEHMLEAVEILELGRKA